MLAAHTRHADRLDHVGNSRRARSSWRLSLQVTLGLALLVIGGVRKVGRQIQLPWPRCQNSNGKTTTIKHITGRISRWPITPALVARFSANGWQRGRSALCMSVEAKSLGD
jgi:hypothetical protein